MKELIKFRRKIDKAPSIESWKYNKNYFLTDCEGYEIFRKYQGRKLSKRLEEFYKRLIFYHTDRVLELGCGRGELCYAIAPDVRYLIGLDYSREAIKLCQEIYKNTSNLNFVVGDAKDLPFSDNSFDLVYCTELLEHLHSWELEKMMKEVVRILDLKGRFIAQTEPNKAYWLASGVWSFLPRAIISIRKRRKINFLIKRPVGHILFHINEQTPWSVKCLIKKYFRKYKIKTYEMVLGQSKLRRFVFNAYPLNYLPGFSQFFNREIYIESNI